MVARGERSQVCVCPKKPLLSFFYGEQVEARQKNQNKIERARGRWSFWNKITSDTPALVLFHDTFGRREREREREIFGREPTGHTLLFFCILTKRREKQVSRETEEKNYLLMCSAACALKSLSGNRHLELLLKPVIFVY